MPVASVIHIGDYVAELHSRRVKFVLLDNIAPPSTIAGRAATLDVWRLKNGEAGPATKIIALGADAGSVGRTLTEVDATNLPGVYELRLAREDLDTVGALCLRVDDTAVGPPVARDMLLMLNVTLREGRIG